MGISLDDFLDGREPCEVCDSSGDQHHCITQLLSRLDCCIFYNAMEINQDRYTPTDVQQLQELRASLDPQRVLEYYFRSRAIVEHINLRPNRISAWQDIYDRYVIELLRKMRGESANAIVDDTFSMLTELEQQFGIAIKH
jgi:hypothetical protein